MIVKKMSRLQQDLLPYKSLGETKYERLGWKYQLKGIESLDSSCLKNIKETIENSGKIVNVGI